MLKPEEISAEYLEYANNLKIWHTHYKNKKDVNIFEKFISEKVPKHLTHKFISFNNKTEQQKLNILYEVAEFNARIYGEQNKFTQRAKIDLLYTEYIKIATL